MYRCTACGEVFTSPKQMNDHLLDVHWETEGGDTIGDDQEQLDQPAHYPRAAEPARLGARSVR